MYHGDQQPHFEGRYSPTNAYGKRTPKNVYAKTREKCEEKLAELITQMNAEIATKKGTDQSGTIGIRCAKVNRHGFRSPWRLEILIDLYRIKGNCFRKILIIKQAIIIIGYKYWRIALFRRNNKRK